MSENRILLKIFKRDLTNRERIITLITLLALAGALIYQFPFRYVTKSVAGLSARTRAVEQDLRSLSLQYADLKTHEADLKAGLKGGIAGWDLVDQRGVILFLDDVSSQARQQGVNLIAVHPAQEIDKETYKELSMNLDLKGRYRELAEYFKHLENLSRIVNIRRIRVEACPDSSSACATQLEAVTYMAK